MKSILLISIFFFIYDSPLSGFPGDQSSLSCIPLDAERTEIQNQYKSEGTSTDGKTSYVCPSADFPDADVCKENNKKLATDRVKKIVLDRHDLTKHFTMLGDSLSDFVDLYGVVDPRKVYGVPIGDVAGYYDGLPFYMDKWDDYLSIGAGLPAGYRQGYQVSNYAKYGFTTASNILNF